MHAPVNVDGAAEVEIGATPPSCKPCRARTRFGTDSNARRPCLIGPPTFAWCRFRAGVQYRFSGIAHQPRPRRRPGYDPKPDRGVYVSSASLMASWRSAAIAANIFRTRSD
jgi:hypothetical protein